MEETGRNTVILLDASELPTPKRKAPPAAPKAKRQRQKRAGLLYHFKHDSAAKNRPLLPENEVINAEAGQSTNKSNIAAYTEVAAMQNDLEKIIARVKRLEQRSKKALPPEPVKTRQTYMNSLQKLMTLLNNFKDRFGGVIMKNTTLTALEAVHWRTSPTSYIHSLSFNLFDVSRAEELVKRLQRTPYEFPTSENDVNECKTALLNEITLISDSLTACEQLVSAQNALYLLYKRMLPSNQETQRQLDALRGIHSQIQSKFMHSPEVTNQRLSLIDPLADVSVVPMQ